MSNIINADNGVVSGVSGLKYSADSSGVLVLQTNGTTAITISAAQVVTFTNPVNFASATFTNLSYTGTLTGGTGVINIGSGQIYKDASGNVGINRTNPAYPLDVTGDIRSSTLVRLNNGTVQANFQTVSTTFALVGTVSNHPFTIRTANTDRMYFASNNPWVGINSSSPTAPLTAVLASGAGNAGVIDMAHPGNSCFGVTAFLRTYAGTDNPSLCLSHYNGGSPVNYGIAVNSSGSLLFNQGTNPAVGPGTTKMTLTSAGNLTVSGTLTSSYHIINTGSAANVFTAFTNNGVTRFLISLSGTEAGGNSGSNLVVGNFNDAGSQIAQPLTIKRDNGYIGISEGSPTSSLTVGGTGTNGTVYVKQNGGSSFGVGVFVEQVSGSDNPSFALKNLTGGFTYGMALDTSGNLCFRANTNPNSGYGTNRMTIANSGVILVNQSAQVASERFGITSENIVASFKGTNTSNVATLRIERSANDGDGVTFFYGAAQKGYISVNSTGTTYNTLSDYRLKEKVKPQVDALSKVLSLKPVSFTWKDSKKADEGFIAHELQAVIPGAVQGKKDELDDEGNPRYQGVDQARIVSVLVAAIQELNAKVEALEAQLAAK